MKTLIVGLGFGQLYKRIYESMGAEIITVDADQSLQPDFTELTTAIDAHPQFDTAHICTPNKTHFALAKALSGYAKIVFVEKDFFLWCSAISFPGRQLKFGSSESATFILKVPEPHL